jgi:predicted transcriptional regulator
MTRSDLASPTDRVVVLGPHQADIMRLLWPRGPATVCQLLIWPAADPPLAYQTIMTVCLRLTEKGILERRLATNADESVRYGQAYIYAPDQRG